MWECLENGGNDSQSVFHKKNLSESIHESIQAGSESFFSPDSTDSRDPTGGGYVVASELADAASARRPPVPLLGGECHGHTCDVPGRSIRPADEACARALS